MEWKTIDSAPTGRVMFVVIGVTDGNGFTGGAAYKTDPWCVWQQPEGVFNRWPHNWKPTHWMPLPPPPSTT